MTILLIGENHQQVEPLIGLNSAAVWRVQLETKDLVMAIALEI